MARKSTRFLLPKRERRGFAYVITRVKYRDKKGRFVKFNPRRKLKMEVYGKTEMNDKLKDINVLHEIQIRKYSVGYAKRKKPVTVEQINKRIKKEMAWPGSRMIEEKINGIIFFISGLVQKKKKKKKNKPSKYATKWFNIPKRDIEGSLDEYSKSIES